MTGVFFADLGSVGPTAPSERDRAVKPDRRAE